MNSIDFKNGILLLQKIPYYNNLDCLQMAVESNCIHFLATPAVQNLITNIWNGKIAHKYGFRFTLNVISICSLVYILHGK